MCIALRIPLPPPLQLSDTKLRLRTSWTTLPQVNLNDYVCESELNFASHYHRVNHGPKVFPKVVSSTIPTRRTDVHGRRWFSPRVIHDPHTQDGRTSQELVIRYLFPRDLVLHSSLSGVTRVNQFPLFHERLVNVIALNYCLLDCRWILYSLKQNGRILHVDFLVKFIICL